MSMFFSGPIFALLLPVRAAYINWRFAPPLWITVLIIIPAVVLAAYLLYRREKTAASLPVKLLLAALRSAIIIIVLLIIFQPVAVTEKPVIKEAILPVLIDESLSMGFKDSYTDPVEMDKIKNLCLPNAAGENPGPSAWTFDQASRMDLVNAFLSNPKLGLINKLNAKVPPHGVRLYSFSSSIQTIDAQTTISSTQPLLVGAGLTATGENTAIGNSLSDLVNDLSGQTIGAVVVISDGRNNTGRDPLDIISSLPVTAKGKPIYTVVVGNTGPRTDLELADLSAPDVAVVNDSISFNYTIKVSNPQLSKNNPLIKLTLLEKSINSQARPEGDAAQSQFVQVAQDEISLDGKNHLSGAIKYKPTKPGDFVYRLQAEALPDETIVENNFLEHYVKVVDNVIKVLYVETYPRWEYRRLKNALIRDKTIKASMFLVSGDPDFIQEASPNAPSLVQFPADAKDLFDYDVIIWGDVDPDYLSTLQVNTEKLLVNVKRFVDEMGGGIAFICGERFNPRSFRRTLLTDLLPLVPAEGGSAFGGEDDPATGAGAGFKLKLTTEGLSDTIMQLDEDPTLNQKIWGSDSTSGIDEGILPGFYWFYPFQKAKPAARVLATHPMSANKFGLRPLIATQFYGQGRTFVIASDETWRWCTFKADKFFYGFWSEAIRFLRGGKLLGNRKIQVLTDKPKYILGEKIRISAKIYDADFKPIKQPTCEGNIINLNSIDGLQTSIILNSIPDKEGQYEYSFTPNEVGFYRITCTLPSGSTNATNQGYSSFAVSYPRIEYENPLPDAELLKKIAAKTNGVALKLSEIDKLPDVIKPAGDIIYTETKENDLWDSPWVFLAFLVLISAEWIIRKLAGLI